MIRFAIDKSEPGSALGLGGRAVGLLEFVEDLGLVGGADSGPGVADRDGERAVGRGRLDGDLAHVRELDRVADQVQQDLRDATLVAVSGAAAAPADRP